MGTNILGYIDANLEDKRVVAFDRYPSHPAHMEFKCISRVYAGDFSDEYLLERVFAENNIDLVIHCLGASVPSQSHDNTFELKYNVLPTIGLMNLMVKYGVKRIVFISSGGAVYGDGRPGAEVHREDDAMYPKSSYGVAKLTIEQYLYLYSVQNGLEPLVLRPSNLYGPNHYSQSQGVVNIAMERALSGKPLEIWGDGNGKKDYVYIEDFCEVLFLLISRWNGSYSVVNVGSGQLLSVNDIVTLLNKYVSPVLKWIYKDANPLDVQDFRLDIGKLKSMIGDYAFTDIGKGIEKTLAWYSRK